MRELRATCRLGREQLRARIIVLRERVKAAIAKMRRGQRDQCALTQAAALAELEHLTTQAGREVVEWRSVLRDRYGTRKKFGGLARLMANTRASESDDEVRANIPAELLPAFERVKSKIKASPRRSRTEAFLQWVHDNEDEAHAILYGSVDREVERLVREQQQLERRLAAVPF